MLKHSTTNSIICCESHSLLMAQTGGYHNACHTGLQFYLLLRTPRVRIFMGRYVFGAYCLICSSYRAWTELLAVNKIRKYLLMFNQSAWPLFLPLCYGFGQK